MVLAEPRPAGFWHAALLHHGVAEFEAAACEFARTAARVGAAVLVVCPARSLGRLRAHLDGLDDRVTWAGHPPGDHERQGLAAKLALPARPEEAGA